MTSPNPDRNIKAILELAELLETEPKGFDMGDPLVKPHCGSAGCIGGHAALIWPEVRSNATQAGTYTWLAHKLAQKLGISAETEQALCYPDTGGRGYRAKAKTAAKVLRGLAKTGKVNWSNPWGRRTRP